MTGDPSPPRPFRSVLLPHLDEIRRMRRARHTWREIAEHLTETHGIRIAPPSVYLFFKRAVRRRTLPLGFEDQPIAHESSAAPHTPAQPPNEEESLELTLQNKETSLMPINQRKKGNWFGYDPEQGIHYVPKN
jgi:hypothetical protein